MASCELIISPAVSRSIRTNVTHRTPPELRGDFKLISTERLPVATALEKFDRLRDETNTAAARLASTQDIGEYITLLQDMDAWYQRSKKIKAQP
jgi:hypothetical protein